MWKNPSLFRVKEANEVWIQNFSIGNKWILGTILYRTGPISYEAFSEQGIVKKQIYHSRERKPIKDEIYPELQLEKWDLHRNETTVNFPVTTNNPSQNIRNPSTQKQLRTQINNVSQLAIDNLIESNLRKVTPGVAAAAVIRILF